MAETICLYFQVHQPHRIRPFSILAGRGGYFDEERNRALVKRAAERCYLPANALMRRLFSRHGERFGVGFSVSGSALDQFALHAPEVIASFASLGPDSGDPAAGRGGPAEFLAETDSHSLAAVFSPAEFREQVLAHEARIESLFGFKPVTFRNTELLYSDGLARTIEEMGFTAALAEGVDRLLRGRSPHHLYRSAGGEIRLLLKDHLFSDDIAFRFTDRSWPGWPLEARSFAARLGAAPGEFVSLFLDYETLGEHHGEKTGIFTFFEAFVDSFLAAPGRRIAGPGAVAAASEARGFYSSPDFTSWADEARDLSAWLGNDMQRTAAKALYDLEEAVKASGDGALIADWRRLQASDLLYYMSTKGADDGRVHDYFNPFETPHDAFASFMNILHHLEGRAKAARKGPGSSRPPPEKK